MFCVMFCHVRAAEQHPSRRTCPIRAEGLSVTKSLAWKADNDNPMAPLFLKMAKQ